MQVGNEQDSKMIGKYGLGLRNERGEKWVQWCTEHSQVITNTCFDEHPRRLWTWKSPGGDTKNQIRLCHHQQTLQKRRFTLKNKPKC